ncbi:MAG: polysaccharide biosynthesis tyrosine autokinase [Planctomycetota bacterium]|nr:polysaccharide biosynthesis tyrosine autokinase [Planctomycetota bacterium]
MIVESNPLADLQKELQDTDLEISITKADIAGMKDGTPKDNRGAQAHIHRTVESDESLVQLKLQLNQKRDSLTKRKAITEGKATGGGNTKMEREVAEIERRIDATRKNLVRDYTEQFATYAESQHQDLLNEATQNLNMLTVKREYLHEQMVQRRTDMKDSSEHITGISFAQNKYDEARVLLSKISERLAQLETESGAASRVQLIDPAARPNVPEPMGLWKKMLAAIAGSLIVPFGLAVLWERAACRITSADQLENQIELPVIGEVARLPLRVKSGNRTRNASARSLVMFEESIDSIRTNLLLHKEKNNLQVIAVCSSVAAEGKTSVSSQLAISLARATGQPTLLIDGDMRAPDLHGVFEIPNETGLVHVLGGEATPQVAINRDWSEHIHILPAGNLNTSPHNLLGQSQFQNLLDGLRTQYRYIIVDTPPVLAASEALIMAAAADGVLVCTMHEKSRGDHLRLTHERLVAAGAKPIGTVLNGVSTRAYAYKYGSYYYGNGRHNYAYSRS